MSCLQKSRTVYGVAFRSLLLLFALAASASATAASFTWTGNGPGNNWDAFIGVTNWMTGASTTQIPNFDDTVLFDSTSTGPILVDLNGTRRVISATFQGTSSIVLDDTNDRLELTSGDLTVNAGNFGYRIDADVMLLSSALWNITQTGSSPGLTVNGDITQSVGGINLTKTGNGVLVLNGNNTYTGTTIISAGSLRVGATNALLNTTVNVNTDNGLDIVTLGVNAQLGGLSGFGDIALGAQSLTVGNNNSSTAYSGVISGTGGLTKSGGGTLSLTGENTYNGTTTVNSGTLSVGSGGSVGSISGNVVNNATLRFNRSTDSTYGGSISGTGTVNKQGAGTLTLTANHSYTGVTTISSGSIELGNGGSTGSINGNISNNGELIFNRSSSYSYSGVISGGGDVTKTGSGTLTLLGNNLYSGDTSIADGILAISQNNRLGSAAGDVLLDGGQLRVLGTHATNRDFAMNASSVIEVSNGISYSVNGLFTGSATLTKSGAGTLIINGNNVDSHNKVFQSGVVQIGSGGTTGTLAGDVVNTASLIFDRSDDSTYSGNLSGTGDLTKNGAGKLTLSGNQSYSGQTNLNAGTLEYSLGLSVGQPGIADTSNVVMLTGSTLNTGSGTDATIGTLGSVSMTSATLNANRLNALFGSQLSGTGAVNAKILADTGSTITAFGNLSLGDATAFNGFYSNGDLTVQSGTATLLDANTAVFDSAANVTLGNGVGTGILGASNGVTLDFGGNISGRGTVDTPNNSTTPLVVNGAITGDSLSEGEKITLPGYVKGVGTLDNVMITGTDALGFSSAAVNRGSVDYAGILQIEIEGASPGSGGYDQINHVLSAGVANLGGTLEVVLNGGFIPTPGDAFNIINATSVVGTFDAFNLPALPTGMGWFLNYSATSVDLVSTYFADFDEDGDVDSDDFTAWDANFGLTSTTHMTGDADADTFTTGADFLTWQQQFDGSSAPSPGLAPIPEPATLMLAILGLALIAPKRLREKADSQ